MRTNHNTHRKGRATRYGLVVAMIALVASPTMATGKPAAEADERGDGIYVPLTGGPVWAAQPTLGLPVGLETENVEFIWDEDPLGDLRVVGAIVEDGQLLDEVLGPLNDPLFLPDTDVGVPQVSYTFATAADGNSCSTEFCWVGKAEYETPKYHCKSNGYHKIGWHGLEAHVYRRNPDYGQYDTLGDLYAIKLVYWTYGRHHSWYMWDDHTRKMQIWMDVDHADEANKAQELWGYEPRGTVEGGYSWNLGVSKNGPSAGVGGTISYGDFRDYSRPQRDYVSWAAWWPHSENLDTETITFEGGATIEVPRGSEGRLTVHVRSTHTMDCVSYAGNSWHEIHMPFSFTAQGVSP